jgi:hypothetical protein
MHVALPKSRSGQNLPPGERRLGFLAAGRDDTLGYVGGYLLTTARGRPLEFHYTSPVKPSPTHRILYGAELEPYIYEELIAASLIQQSSIEPAFLITDQPLVLRHRTRSSCPLLCWVAKPPALEASAETATCSCELKTHADFAQDRDALNQWLAETNPGLDLGEPFPRVWEALREVLGGDVKREAA